MAYGLLLEQHKWNTAQVPNTTTAMPDRFFYISRILKCFDNNLMLALRPLEIYGKSSHILDVFSFMYM